MPINDPELKAAREQFFRQNDLLLAEIQSLKNKSVNRRTAGNPLARVLKIFKKKSRKIEAINT